MNFSAARHNMIECQIRTNRVLDPAVIAALADIPRESFVPKAMRGFAYVDEDLDIGGGRVIIEPLALARLLEAARIKPTDVVLNIGDAPGYSTAVLSRLSQTVVSLECDSDWVAKANTSLSELGIDNAAVVQGPLDLGYPAQAPYDVIVFSGAIADVPASICRQLGEGGRLVAIVDGGRGIGRGTLVVRVGDTWGRRQLFDARIPLLPGFAAKTKFVF
ncbi:protein-L-isoaspartate O-methyltransferase family protein [Magnetospirillum sulfuroxidans]|uniref:Protein-L-isoaspartate O-methyltransferase n=1 Tax=Magnetospirillum sulfuroxidans TaxID=611300 RepID=A0ABS5I7U8_9PROT|nr:protein-L-isoaspartate O-methyltransferase [Magnetospirillum sulfuroxidans]MBR9970502.1 protein-L-isoaspartate O-methyltransferase [Magnetospirillum sulfuroxidans]